MLTKIYNFNLPYYIVRIKNTVFLYFAIRIRWLTCADHFNIEWLQWVLFIYFPTNFPLGYWQYWCNQAINQLAIGLESLAPYKGFLLFGLVRGIDDITTTVCTVQKKMEYVNWIGDIKNQIELCLSQAICQQLIWKRFIHQWTTIPVCRYLNGRPFTEALEVN